MSKKKSRFFVTLLAVMLCMAVFSSVAYAGGGPETEPTPTAIPLPNPFTPDGTGTVLDNATDEDGKEFFTIITPNENVFYLIIDRQRENNNVYFLNAVTEKDLLALAEAVEDTEPVISTPTPQPAPEPEPQPEQEQKPEPESQSNTGGIIALLLIVAVIAAGVACFFKFRKPTPSVKGKSDLDEYDFGEDEDEPYEDEDAAQEADTETEDEQQ